MKNRLLTGVGILGWMCTARVSLGQTAVDAAELFERAKKLMDAGDLAVACPMTQQSYDLEPKVGRLYTLATCRDREGRMATALDLYRTYLRSVSEMNEQTRSNHADREKTASERVKALEVQVPKLKLVWRGNVPKDVKVTVGGVDALTELNTEWPLDPGEHWVVVERGGHAEAPRVITLESDKPTMEVDLTPQPPVVPVEKKPMEVKPMTVQPQEKPAKPLAVVPTNPASFFMSQRTAGGMLLGVGGVGAATGAVLGIMASAAKTETNDACTPNGSKFDCTPAGRAAAEQTLMLGNATTWTFVASGAFAIVGLVELWGRGTPRKEQIGLAGLRVAVSPDPGFVTIGGRF